MNFKEYFLLENKFLKWNQLTDIQRRAIWKYMWHEGGFDTKEEAKRAVESARFIIEIIPVQTVINTLKNWKWPTEQDDLKLQYPYDFQRVKRIIQKQKVAKQKRWPYIAALTNTFKDWALDEAHHGDGYHRILAAYWTGKPNIEFIFF